MNTQGLWLFLLTPSKRKTPAMDIQLRFVACSLSRIVVYWDITLTKHFKRGGGACGWSSFIEYIDFQTSVVMQRDNALVIDVMVQSPPLRPTIHSDTILDLLHFHMTSTHLSDAQFVAFSVQVPPGQLKLKQVCCYG